MSREDEEKSTHTHTLTEANRVYNQLALEQSVGNRDKCQAHFQINHFEVVD